jgi:hypothetical protein
LKGKLLHLDEVMTMTDLRTAKITVHRRNIHRYARLLATQLTDLERKYLHKRIAEEQAELELLELQANQAIEKMPPKRSEAVTQTA